MNLRHEFKYRINYLDYIIIRQRISAVMDRDEHANSSGIYKIRSVYFDNLDDTALREKIDGVNRREKFRLRFYNGDESIIKLEKKSKLNGLCNKQSATISAEKAHAILGGNTEWMAYEGGLMSELYAKMKVKGIAPKTIVDYTREPYVYRPGNVRITIDRDIRTGLYSTDAFGSPPMIPAGEAPIILEIKYDSFLPDHIKSALQLENACYGSFSKYAVCRTFG